MMWRTLDEIFDAILSINEDAAYKFVQKFSHKDKKKLHESTSYIFGDGKYAVKFEDGVRFADADELYLYENTERGLENIGEVTLV